MTIKEMPRMYYGADVKTSGGPVESLTAGETTLVSDNLGNNCHYTLAEVTDRGAVVKGRDDRYKRLHLEDLGDEGVQVLRGVNDNPVVGPGQKLKVAVGSCQAEIEGTAQRGVTLNGKPSIAVNRQIEGIRYPKF